MNIPIDEQILFAKEFSKVNVYGAAILATLERVKAAETGLPVEPEIVGWLEHHKAGDNIGWEQVDHPYAKADALVKKSDYDTTRAYAAQQPQEPVAKVKRNSGVNGREFVGETLEFRDLPVGTRLYTAPASGVREGMLLDALQRAQRVMHGEGVEDQGEAWDKCAQILDEAITHAAGQVNAESCTRSHPHENMSVECERKTDEARENNVRRNAELGNAPHSASQPDTVAVPIHQLEHWAEYWNGSANEKAMSDALEHILGEVDDLLRAAQEGKC